MADSYVPDRQGLEELGLLEGFLLKANYKVEPISYFTHATTMKNSQSITLTQRLQSDTVKHSPVLPEDDFKGVWFSPTLFQGRLPDQCPFGEVAYRLPVELLWPPNKEVEVYLDTMYRFWESSCHQYVRLVAIEKTDDSRREFCRQNLAKLDLETSMLFQVNSRGMFCLKNEKDHPIQVWVELFYVCDDGVDLGCNTRVEFVEASRRSTREWRCYGLCESVLEFMS